MIVLQAYTGKQVDSFLKRPSHGVILSGPEGAGKYFTAQYIATKLLGLESPDKLHAHPYFQAIPPDNGSISIGQIRNLHKFLQLKTTGSASIRRLVIIQNAHLMTIEAQNALLKALEEPPDDTVIILTAPDTKQLKDTIYSRVQKIPIMPLSRSILREKFSAEISEQAIDKAYMLSGGYTGLFCALIREQDHSLAQAIQLAKSVLTSTLYARLNMVDEVAKQKDQIPMLLQAFKIIASTALDQAAKSKNDTQIKRWHAALASFYRAEASLVHNPNSKLLLTDIFLSV